MSQIINRKMEGEWKRSSYFIQNMFIGRG